MMKPYTNAPLSQFKETSANSWRYDTIHISPYALKTVTFSDTQPNMFLIQNGNNAKLHVGLAQIPTDEVCEFKINPNTSKPFGRPIPCSEIYIRNCSGEEVSINLFSLAGEFDMSILCNSDVDLSIGGMNTYITGFNEPLPEGDNNIGSVTVNEAVKTVGLMGENVMQYYNADNIPSDFNNDVLGFALTQIIDAIKNIKVSSGESTEEIFYPHQFTATTSSTSHNAPEIYKINFLSNDSTEDLTIICGGYALTLKSGEVLTDVTFKTTGGKMYYRGKGLFRIVDNSPSTV